ncbi:GNAT family N-acetyltransferase [Halobacillus kuroshimensis]|uniref:GNAT family N-acetyltransferase n=1 Tax=Halobacillus kuroshimensis TaxID=302481 RepID=A0ABS3DV41_9BACI|nr:GNAT family N-acetyltransferase [Halobacillus kuroshimensis]MBN8235222.1 GNAT family N-acetyltransferase [Halobacillus kuroshimensis]
MAISYASTTRDITRDDLQTLFHSVEWDSGSYPDELLQAIQGSHSVMTAWDGRRLIGLVNALSDGVLTVYFHYMLIDPEYQGRGIGKVMMDHMLDQYKTYQTKVLIAYPDVVEFYGKLGFQKEEGTTPLFISDLI